MIDHMIDVRYQRTVTDLSLVLRFRFLDFYNSILSNCNIRFAIHTSATLTLIMDSRNAFLTCLV